MIAFHWGFFCLNLPAQVLVLVIIMDVFIKDLEMALGTELPGPEAQYRMAHVSRQGREGAPSGARQAGVLALFFPKESEWHLVFIERVVNANDRHSGQISFPGGRLDPSDRNLAQTALREAEEEVGVPASRIKLLGQLSELYIPVSNYRVEPYVGFLDHAPLFVPEQSEVASILQVPFRTFLDDSNVRIGALQVNPEFSLPDVPFYQVREKVIWGATAMMMSELVTLVKKQAVTLP